MRGIASLWPRFMRVLGSHLWFSCGIAGLAIVVIFLVAWPRPSSLHLLGGISGGTYQRLAERFKLLVGDGFDKVTVEPSEGSVDNLLILGKEKADCGIISGSVLAKASDVLENGGMDPKQVSRQLFVAGRIDTDFVHVVVRSDETAASFEQFLRDPRKALFAGQPGEGFISVRISPGSPRI